MHERRLKIFLFLLFMLVLFCFFYFGVPKYLTFENIKNSQDDLVDYYGDHTYFALLVFFMICTAWTAFSFPVPLLLTITGGAIFGIAVTVPLAVLSVALGGTMAFLSSRYIFGKLVGDKFGGHLKAFEEEIERNGVYYLLFVRLIPGVPYFLVNILAGVTRVKSMTFFWTTLVGLIPLVVIEANAGQQLANIDSPEEIFTPGIMISLGLLGVISILPVLYRKIKRKKPAAA